MNGSAPTTGTYSFYLNVVVIDSRADDGTDGSKDGEPPLKEEEEQQEEAPTTSEKSGEESAEVPSPTANGDNTESNGEMVKSAENKAEEGKMKLLMEGKALMDFAFQRKRGGGSTPRNKSDGSNASGKNVVKDGRAFMSNLGNSIGSSISKSSSNISKRASRYMANKTMVSRAEKAVSECIPLVTEEIGVEMSISKRFQQGPVFVLEVDMKGCEILDLLSTVLGEDAAQHYSSVKAGLEFLELPTAKEAFLKEILPKLRKAMMGKMSEIVPQKMKLKKQYADLEIQCVALEDAEEAKWLYNFLAFMEEMK